jgi:hypothetical protein
LADDEDDDNRRLQHRTNCDALTRYGGLGRRINPAIPPKYMILPWRLGAVAVRVRQTPEKKLSGISHD